MNALATVIVISRAGVRTGLARVAAWQQQRRTYEALMRASDHLLADIGIERARGRAGREGHRSAALRRQQRRLAGLVA